MKRRPNILWIGLDQFRYDTPGCNGNPVCQTPVMDALAARGVAFDRAYTPSSLCTPARTSMLTGKFAFHHGLITNCDMYHAPVAELPRPEDLLHHRLAEAGYRCGYVGKGHVGARLGPLDYGFEGFSPTGYGAIRHDPAYRRYLQESGLDYRLRDMIFANPDAQTCLGGVWDGPVESTPAYFLAEQTRQWMGELAADDRPFFLSCQFWGPHGPCFPSREYAGMHDRSKIEPWANFQDAAEDKPAMVRRIRTDFFRALPRDWHDWREVIGLYYDFTTMIDAQIGRILAQLETLGLAGETIVVLTTDHGDMTGSHGGMNDKGLMYEEAHHIPLIVDWPGVAATGKRTRAMVYNMDVFPTLLDGLGLPAEGLDACSFLPALKTPDAAVGRTEIYLEFHGIRFLYSQRALVTEDGWKFVFTPGDRDEVYDLNTDPAELCNLIDAPDHADTVRRLRERIMQAALRSRDPLAACVCKYFGHWDRNPEQIDAARVETTQPKREGTL